VFQLAIYNPMELNEIVDLISDGNYYTAKRELLKLYEKNKKDSEVLYNLGFSCRGTREFDEAEKFYKLALDLNPSFSHASLGLGIVYQLQEKFPEAIKHLENATIDIFFIDAFNSLGLTYKKMGLLDLAINTYREAIYNYILKTYRKICSREKTNISPQKRTPTGLWFDILMQVITKESQSEKMPFPPELVAKELKKNVLYAILLNNLGVALAEFGNKNEARIFLKESIVFTPSGYYYSEPQIGLKELDEK
jgi:tetratricopeptide (TPR) repeat protein